MTTRLLLLIDEHWPAEPSAPWVVLDHGGNVVSEGVSEPRHWPAADECAIVLGGSQCSWLRARLPRGARREEARLLAYALEDRLLRDPDSQHLVVTRRTSGEAGVEVEVLIVARERLRSLLAQFAAIGRAPLAAMAELQCAPASDGAWHLALRDGAIVLRVGEAGAQCFDPPAEAALPLLHHALQTARAANTLPDRIELHLAPGCGLHWPESAVDPDCQLREGEPYLWWRGQALAANLLQGEFAPRHQRGSWLHKLRWPLRLAAASAAALLLAGLGEVLWQRHRLGELEARMNRLFETTLPNTPAIAPAAQLQRQLDELRMRHGRLREDDLLTLLSAYGQARGVATRDSVAAASYRDGRLELQLPALDAGARAALRRRLSALGYATPDGGEPTTLVLGAEVVR